MQELQEAVTSPLPQPKLAGPRGSAREPQGTAGVPEARDGAEDARS